LVEKYKTQLDDLIKAGIYSIFNLGNSAKEKHLLNLKYLAEFINKQELINFKDPETQIIFVKALSFIIEGSALSITALATKCMEAISSHNEEASSKFSV